MVKTLNIKLSPKNIEVTEETLPEEEPIKTDILLAPDVEHTLHIQLHDPKTRIEVNAVAEALELELLRLLISKLKE